MGTKKLVNWPFRFCDKVISLSNSLDVMESPTQITESFYATTN